LKVPIDPEFNAEPVETEIRARWLHMFDPNLLRVSGCWGLYEYLGLFNRSAKAEALPGVARTGYLPQS